jgi:hypothetical protein
MSSFRVMSEIRGDFMRKVGARHSSINSKMPLHYGRAF